MLNASSFQTIHRLLHETGEIRRIEQEVLIQFSPPKRNRTQETQGKHVRLVHTQQRTPRLLCSTSASLGVFLGPGELGGVQYVFHEEKPNAPYL